MIWFKNQPIGFCESDGELSSFVVLKLVTKHRWPMWYVGVRQVAHHSNVH